MRILIKKSGKREKKKKSTWQKVFKESICGRRKLNGEIFFLFPFCSFFIFLRRREKGRENRDKSIRDNEICR